MKLTIFFRLLIGYFIIFVLVIGINAYAIIEIGRINEVTQSILTVNNQMIDLRAKLSDIIFSQVRYERKFIISKDEAFFNGFLQLKDDFNRCLKEMTSIADSSQVKTTLSNISTSYQKYQSLFQEESDYLKSGARYPHRSFDSEKKRATSSIMDELEKLETRTKQDTTDKIKRLHGIGTDLRRTVIGMTGAFLIFGIVISLLINRSITQPVSLLGEKTKDIGKGNFRGDLNISSPPELAELADAFNLMCKKLNELDKMKSDFFSSITHELRTPLTTIKMASGLLRAGVEEPLTKGQKDILTTLEKETNQLIGLVNSILDLSKMEAGMMSFHLEPRDIGPLIDQALKETGLLMEAKKIHLETRVTKEMPIVRVDSEKILQALRNIIGNAVKFTPEAGRITISARSIDHGVEVSVSDTGPGIPAENLVTVFEKFQQAPAKGSSPNKGTGLGLAIVKEIITRHGGRIWAESRAGRGSTLIFVLPA
ncbi:MAG TPA: ATP-binding protein [Thermodesulfobacteriota bacterium]|nr:ATP-binding protein [Thermodesulfobacteriota bacterium]